MANTVYFGVGYLTYNNNGNWSDVNQFWSDPGEGGERPRNPVRLGRFPNPATEIVDGRYQEILTGVGTYTGPVTYGQFKDANAVFTGNLSYPTFFAGTFSGSMDLRVQIYGGTFTSNVNFNSAYSIEIRESNAGRSDGTRYPLTFPSNLSISNFTGGIYINRQMTWNYPIVFSNSNTASQLLQFGIGAVTRELPTVTIDISTSATNCIGYYFNFQTSSNSLIDLNTVFTNSNELIFGSPTNPCYFNLYYVAPNRKITAYIGGRGDCTILCGNNTPVYDQLYLNQLSGGSFAQVYVYSPVTWRTTYNLPLTYVTTSTKYKILQSNFPQQYTFGINSGSVFDGTLNLNLTKNLTAISE